MLYWMCDKTEKQPTGPQLLHAIRRNFGGLQDEKFNPEEEFLRRLPNTINQPLDLINFPMDVC